MNKVSSLAIGFGLALSSQAFGGMSYHCHTSTASTASLGQMFVVTENGAHATVSVGGTPQSLNVLIAESSQNHAPSIGVAHGSIASEMTAVMTQRNSSTRVRTDVSSNFQGVELNDRALVLEISRPVGAYGTFAASVALWTEFKDGTRVNTCQATEDASACGNLMFELNCESNQL